MIAPTNECQHENSTRSGRNRNQTQRYCCSDCGRYFSDELPPQPLGHLRIGMDRAVMVLSLLLEGMSVRATQRLTGVCRGTIADLLLIAGQKCADFMDSKIVNVKSDFIEIDELWSKVYCSEKVAKAQEFNLNTRGSSWTFIALDADSKLVLNYHIGLRNSIATTRFLRKLRRAIDVTRPFQVTTCLLYTSPSPRDQSGSRMPSSA